MEYFSYNYKNVESEINFNNYDKFITNLKTYKYYLFDLALLQHDIKTEPEYRQKAKNIIFRQKILLIVPYIAIFSTFFYYYRRNFFQVKLLQKESKIVSNLFLFLLANRIFQKGLLKYEGDKLLIPVAKEGKHSI